MSNKKIIYELSNLNYINKSSLVKEVDTLDNSKDLLYNACLVIFQDSSIDHKKRLSLLKILHKVSLKHRIDFCSAHSLNLIIKVSRELGLQNTLIKDSHKVIETWKSILNESLAINGLIFSYTDLGLIFSDFNLHTLALKYLDKAESLICECENKYNVSSKLYVAYAVVLDRLKNQKKADLYYSKVIKLAESKKDTLTQIPIMINIANGLIDKNKFIESEKYLNKALKFSNQNEEKIYKPYIYLSLGKVLLEKNNYKKSKIYFEQSLDLFNEMNSIKMISQALFYKGLVSLKEKKYKNALDIFESVLIKNKNINDYDLEINTLKKIASIYKIKKDNSLYLSTLTSLNKALEKKLKNKEAIFSSTSENALKHLSEEFDSSIMKQKDIKVKINLQSKQRQLTTQALVSVSEKEFLAKLLNELSEQNINNSRIVQLCSSRMQHTKDWNIFMKLFNDINPDFNKYIINKCSLITESELRVCNLIKMSFSSSEIAEILSITKRGVEQHRYRIRKKLNLKSDLSIFIHSL